jgi:hypothetical protein
MNSLIAANASVAVLGSVVSEVAMATSRSDAKYGTLANLILLLAAGYGFASRGALDTVLTSRPRGGPGRSLVSDQRLRDVRRRKRHGEDAEQPAQ